MSLVLIFLILKIYYNGINSEIFNQIWYPELLYDYTKKYYLDNNNPEKAENLKHMIVDPENYLKDTNLSLEDIINDETKQLEITYKFIYRKRK